MCEQEMLYNEGLDVRCLTDIVAHTVAEERKIHLAQAWIKQEISASILTLGPG
uniref:Uncharacterized protein n=1 Tax=Arion vulgaris TaxID=1028688 RepID=A0A0B6Y7X5_9EUPU